jgi:hypothetical protein
VGFDPVPVDPSAGVPISLVLRWLAMSAPAILLGTQISFLVFIYDISSVTKDDKQQGSYEKLQLLRISLASYILIVYC